MADIREIKSAMQKKKRAKTVRRIAILIILLTLAVMVIIGGDKLSPEAISDWLSQSVNQNGGAEGFPVSLPSGEFSALCPLQSNLVAVNQTNIYIYSGRGKQLRSIAHSRKNVQTKTAGENALIYSVGGEELSVETASKTIASLKTGKSIITADISKSGRFAVATESDVYTSEMTVYDKNGNGVFKWTPSGSVISAVSISDDGHFVAAATLKTQGGKLVSGVHLFQTSKEDALFSYYTENEMVLSLFANRSGAIALCTEKVIYLDDNGELIEEYSYNEKALIDYKECSEGLALAFRDVNDPGRSVIEIVSEKGSLKAEAKIGFAVKAISASGDDIYAASDEKLIKYKASTAIKSAQAEFDEDMLKLSSTSAGAYAIDAAGKLIRPEFK